VAALAFGSRDLEFRELGKQNEEKRETVQAIEPTLPSFGA